MLHGVMDPVRCLSPAEMERVPTAGGAMGTQDDRRVRLR